MFTNKIAYRSASRKGEPNSGKQMTIQNDALSIKQIIERYQNGIPVQFKQSEYLDVEDVRNINYFYSPAIDLTDLETLDNQLQRLNATAEALQKQKNAISKKPEADEAEVIDG